LDAPARPLDDLRADRRYLHSVRAPRAAGHGDAPGWLGAATYISIGWIAIFAMPELLERLGIAAVTALALGGILYSVGGVIYARKRPDPAPKVFGYHEVFHLLVIAAAALQYAVVAFWVL
jgi:hemolysin III